jgi:hypothetical protein
VNNSTANNSIKQKQFARSKLIQSKIIQLVNNEPQKPLAVFHHEKRSFLFCAVRGFAPLANNLQHYKNG